MDQPNLEAELRKDILLGFHTQFAENQRSREGTFLQFLTLLAAALAGYAFLFRTSNDVTYSTSAVLFFQAAISTVLFAGARLVVVISNNFRRDQLVNVRIRRAANLIGSQKIFPESYDPRIGMRQWGLFSWMPDFFQAMFWLFVIFQIAALIAFANLLKLYIGSPVDINITLVVALSVVLALWSTFVVPWKYRAKLLPVMELDPVECGIPAAVGRRLGKVKIGEALARACERMKAGFRFGREETRSSRFVVIQAFSPNTTDEKISEFRLAVEEAAKAADLCVADRSSMKGRRSLADDTPRPV